MGNCFTVFTKRKITTTKGTTIVTYKKLNTPEIKKAGILETKKDKISKYNFDMIQK